MIIANAKPVHHHDTKIEGLSCRALLAGGGLEYNRADRIMAAYADAHQPPKRGERRCEDSEQSMVMLLLFPKDWVYVVMKPGRTLGPCFRQLVNSDATMPRLERTMQLCVDRTVQIIYLNEEILRNYDLLVVIEKTVYREGKSEFDKDGQQARGMMIRYYLGPDSIRPNIDKSAGTLATGCPSCYRIYFVIAQPATIQRVRRAREPLSPPPHSPPRIGKAPKPRNSPARRPLNSVVVDRKPTWGEGDHGGGGPNLVERKGSLFHLVLRTAKTSPTSSLLHRWQQL